LTPLRYFSAHGLELRRGFLPSLHYFLSHGFEFRRGILLERFQALIDVVKPIQHEFQAGIRPFLAVGLLAAGLLARILSLGWHGYLPR
jgi:hypothetical protein